MNIKISQIIKWGVPPICLSVATVIFLLILSISPRDAPLAFTVFLTAVACIYDFTSFKIPHWIPVSMVIAGGLYFISLWAGLITIPSDLAFTESSSILLPFLWLGGIIGSAFISSLVFGVIGTGEQDIYLMIGIGALMPIRTLYNMGSSVMFGTNHAMLFIISVILNAITIGAVVAFILGFARQRIYGVPKIIQTASMEIKKSSINKSVLLALSVITFWAVVRGLLVLLNIGQSLLMENTLITGVIWMIICVTSIFFVLYNVYLGVINSLIVIFFVPTFLPFSAIMSSYGAYIMIILVVLTVIMLIHASFDGINAICKHIGKKPLEGFPFAPAILIGLIIAAIWGDFLLGLVCPIFLAS